MVCPIPAMHKDSSHGHRLGDGNRLRLCECFHCCTFMPVDHSCGTFERIRNVSELCDEFLNSQREGRGERLGTNPSGLETAGGRPFRTVLLRKFGRRFLRDLGPCVMPKWQPLVTNAGTFITTLVVDFILAADLLDNQCRFLSPSCLFTPTIWKFRQG
jgi:hypothetical protein